MIVPWCVFLCFHNPACKRDLVYRGESWQKEVVGYNTNKTMCEGGEQVGVSGNPQRTVLAGHNCRVLCLAGCTAKYFFFDFPSVPLRSHSATNPQPHQDFESLTISFGRLNPRSVGGLMGQWEMCNWWKHGKVTKKKHVHVQYVWYPIQIGVVPLTDTIHVGHTDISSHAMLPYGGWRIQQCAQWWWSQGCRFQRSVKLYDILQQNPGG